MHGSSVNAGTKCITFLTMVGTSDIAAVDVFNSWGLNIPGDLFEERGKLTKAKAKVLYKSMRKRACARQNPSRIEKIRRNEVAMQC